MRSRESLYHIIILIRNTWHLFDYFNMLVHFDFTITTHQLNYTTLTPTPVRPGTAVTAPSMRRCRVRVDFRHTYWVDRLVSASRDPAPESAVGPCRHVDMPSATACCRPCLLGREAFALETESDRSILCCRPRERWCVSPPPEAPPSRPECD